MLGGIAFQLGSSVSVITLENTAYWIHTAVIVFYSILAVEYYIRYHLRAPIASENKESGVQARGQYTGKLELMT